MNLLAAVPGKRYLVVRIQDEDVKRQAECLGMGEGEEVYVCARQSEGPVIMASSGQMVAVGGPTAKGIQISPLRNPRT